MSDSVQVTAVSPALRMIVWLCDEAGLTFDQAERTVVAMTYVDDDGLRQFLPEYIPHLPRAAFPPPEHLEGI